MDWTPTLGCFHQETSPRPDVMIDDLLAWPLRDLEMRVHRIMMETDYFNDLMNQENLVSVKSPAAEAPTHQSK